MATVPEGRPRAYHPALRTCVTGMPTGTAAVRGRLASELRMSAYAIIEIRIVPC